MARKVKLSDLPPDIQEQVRQQLLPKGVKDQDQPRTQGSSRMNKLEAAFARHLALLQTKGDIKVWMFESIKLRLADRTWYTPDFCVIDDGGIEFVEVKGFMRDDAAVKLKVAAEMYPHFHFTLVKRDRTGWLFKSIWRRCNVKTLREGGRG